MKNLYRKINKSHLSLGDLVAIVGSCSKNNKETLATLVDLFSTGRVQAKTAGKLKRIRLSSQPA